MKKFVTLSLALVTLLAIGLMVGCDNAALGPGLGQGSGQVASIELRATHYTIRGFQNEHREETLTAVARDNQGVALPGVVIDFAILSPKPEPGTISKSATDSVSNASGEVVATYKVDINQSATVVFEARSGSVTKTITILIEVVNDIVGSVTLEPARKTLAVPPGQTRSTSVQATVVDIAGNALRGMQVHFRTNPSNLGVIDSDTGTTDFSGKVTRNFTTLVNKYGTCNVIAQVGDTVGSVAIVIRQVAAPAAVELTTPTPVVVVPDGQSATISLFASVTDSHNVGVPGATLQYQVLPNVAGGPTFGFLAPSDTTDEEGRNSTTFDSRGGFGKLHIKVIVVQSAAEAGAIGSGSLGGKLGGKAGRRVSGGDEAEIAAVISIEVKKLSSEVGLLSLRAVPSDLKLMPDSLGRSLIQANVLDTNRIGIPNMQVNFTTTLGSLSGVTLTDSTGLATAEFQNNGQVGTATITASIPGTLLRQTTTIRVAYYIVGSISVESERSMLAVPPNETRSTPITVTVVDNEGNALPGMSVRFSANPANLGVIDNAAGTTDGSGKITRNFTTVANQYGVCNVTAQVGGIVGSSSINIQRVTAAAAVTLTTPTPVVSVPAGQNAMIQLFAEVTDAGGVGVPDTPLEFKILPDVAGGATFGAVTANDTTDLDGGGSTTFNSNGGFGELRIEVRVVAGNAAAGSGGSGGLLGGRVRGGAGRRVASADAGEIVAEVRIQVRRLSDIGSLSLRAVPDTLRLAPDSLGRAQVRAQVRDVNNVGVPNVQVNFTTDLGALSNVTQTDASGLATADFQSNYQIGTARIRASIPGTDFAAEATIEVANHIIGSITVDPGRRFLAVPPNQTLSTPITVTVVDDRGNALRGMAVQFSISPPSLGVIDSYTGTTDSSGKVIRTFSSVANRYGVCNVTAAVGESVGSVAIEVRSVAKPAFVTLTTPTPTVTVPAGSDALIKLFTTVTDSNRVGVPGATLEYQVHPDVPGGPTFGFIAAHDTTDQDGRDSTMFNSQGGFGKLRIRVLVVPTNPEAGGAPGSRPFGGRIRGKAGNRVAGADESEIIAEVRIEVKQLTSEIGSLTVGAFPSELKLPPDSLGRSQIRAQVRDVDNVGIADVPVDFTTDLGGLSRVTLTDSTGLATADFQTDYAVGTATIRATIPGTNFTAVATIRIATYTVASVTVVPSQRLLTVPPNQTRSTTISATVIDADGNALPGMTVRFRTSPPSVGVVDSDTGTTDFSGRVTRNFTSIVNSYGVCTVIAQVGAVVGSNTIDIRVTGAAKNVSLMTPTPLVKVAANQSAIIKLYTQVTDTFHVGVPGVSLEYQVHPFVEGGPTFGAITARDTTDAAGQDSTTFNSQGGFGKLRIRVLVVPSIPEAGGRGSGGPFGGKAGRRVMGADEELFAEVTIEVKQLLSEVGSLTVRAFPNFMTLPPDSLGLSQVRAQVRDYERVGIPNVQVNFTTDLGSLSNISVTDTTGVASAEFRTNYESGTATIVATIPGTEFEATTTIVVQYAANLTGTLDLVTNKDFIYADSNDSTFAILTATLKDADDQAIVDRDIMFASRHGVVSPVVKTDSLGRARAVFNDIGLPSDSMGLVPAKIYARYNPMGLIDSVLIPIRPRNPVARITLISAQSQMQAGSGDTSAIRATCFLEGDDFAPVGTLVQFEVGSNNGWFTSDAVPVGDLGVAENVYHAGNFVGTAVLRAFVRNEGEDEDVVYSNEVNIALLAGPPSSIRLEAFPTELDIGDPSAFSRIIATVTDTTGNAVAQGTLVRFSTTEGVVTASAQTDSTGRAEGRLTPGVNAGVAEITGTVNVVGGTITHTVTVRFKAGYPNSIELTADPLQIAVAGTGGVSTSTLTATVRDAHNNLIERATMVGFQILNNPALPLGCKLNNAENISIDSARTASGVAVASLNSGTQVGGVTIRALTWRDPDSTNGRWVPNEVGPDSTWKWRLDTVQVSLPSVAVIAGPPLLLDVDVNDDGDDAGGGVWQVPVSAKVWDANYNPVADRIPVVFTVGQGDHASIEAGYTGNDIGDGPRPGVAFTWLRYHSVNTFEPVTITANVQGERGLIWGDRAHVLALQDGALELNVDPQNWMYDRARPTDSCRIRVWVVLTDGHQITINNGPILFRTDRGRFYWLNLGFAPPRMTMFFPNPVRKLTGVVDQQNNEAPGQATVYLRADMNAIYLDDFTLEVTVNVEASVEGYDVAADPGFIYMTRH